MDLINNTEKHTSKLGDISISNTISMKMQSHESNYKNTTSLSTESLTNNDG